MSHDKQAVLLTRLIQAVTRNSQVSFLDPSATCVVEPTSQPWNPISLQRLANLPVDDDEQAVAQASHTVTGGRAVHPAVFAATGCRHYVPRLESDPVSEERDGLQFQQVSPN